MVSRTQELYNYAKQKRIPGGTQLLSKRPEMMAPDLWPAYYKKASGCEITDLDDKTYYDMSTCGIGSCLLGFAEPSVVEAVEKTIRDGSMCSLNPPQEVELADRLCQIHPWASNVRLTRAGGESMAVAVRIARATTGRSEVAVCGYHGWCDWYLAANLGDNEKLRNMLLPGLDAFGVPRELRGTTHPFNYGDFEMFKEMMSRHGDMLAAVVMEPVRHHLPPAGFLELIRAECDKHGALLVFDEITIGWRYAFGGSHLKLGIAPDIAVFAKALGNGHPIGAIIGTKQAMNGANQTFISSTYWTEGVGPVAALATIAAMERLDASAYAKKTGDEFMSILQGKALRHGLKLKATSEFGCLATFSIEHRQPQELRTLFTQMMLDRGFLAGYGFYPTTAHTHEILEKFSSALDDVFAGMALAINEDRVAQCLRGPVAHSGFKRLN